jgi:regulator of protease activity HflC (stomatin/prohibitin superfamily)
MSDFLGRLLDFLREFWPVRIVMQWEAGCLYRGGRFWRVVGPGWYLVVPFFWDLRVEPVARTTYVTPLQTVGTIDGGTLTFSAAIQVEVVDVRLAQVRVLNYDETALEDTGALLADVLSRTPATSLDPENRAALLRRCRDRLQQELGEYGLKVLTLRFNNFGRNMKVWRIFNDQAYTNRT